LLLSWIFLTASLACGGWQGSVYISPNGKSSTIFGFLGDQTQLLLEILRKAFRHRYIHMFSISSEGLAEFLSNDEEKWLENRHFSIVGENGLATGQTFGLAGRIHPHCPIEE